jgi:hypothetical protein
MPARGRFDASALDASVASCRTWLGRAPLNRELDRVAWKARLELLSSIFAILIK